VAEHVGFVDLGAAPQNGVRRPTPSGIVSCTGTLDFKGRPIDRTTQHRSVIA
jgi:hypothetical protein